MEIVPPAPVEEMEPPEGSDATVPVIPMGMEVLVVEAAIVAETTATTPFPIAVEFKPNTTQLRVPVPLQLTLFPAAVAAVPALTVIEDISAAKYPSVHCTAAGSVAPFGAIDMKRLTVDPGAPDTELLEMLTCARADEARPKKANSNNIAVNPNRGNRPVPAKTIVVDL